ncbi:MAG: HigA family addiction module antitoxin [Devosia sp.]
MALKFKTALHPGEMLREEFLVPLGLSAGGLARDLGVPRTRVERIVKEEMGISVDTALRLARYFGTTPNFWLSLQTSYELAVKSEALKDELAAIKRRAA